MSTLAQPNRSAKNPIGMGEKIGYGLGDMACGIVFSSVSMYLTIFYTDVFGISAAVVGVIFFVSRIIDAITDPIMGSIIDRNQFKDGKFRPYLKWGSIPFIIAIVLCFTTMPGLPMVGKIIYAFVTYIFLILVYTMINIPYGALTSAMTRDSNQLASITSVRMYFANVASIIVAFFVPTLAHFFATKTSPEHSYQLTMLVLSIGGAIFLMITYGTTRERISLPKTTEKISMGDIKLIFKKNRPLVVICLLFVVNFAILSIVNGAGSYYVTYNLGRRDLLRWFMLLGNLPAFLVMPLIPLLVRSFGKKSVLYLSAIIYAVALLSLYFIPSTNIPLIFTIRFVAAIGGVISGYTWALIPEIIVYGEYQTGKRMSGLTYAIVGFFFKLGMALGGIILGIILHVFRYEPNQVQSPQALNGIALLFTVVPVCLLIVTIFIIKKYDLDEERYAHVLSIIEERENRI